MTHKEKGSSVEMIEHYSGDELRTVFIQGKEWVPKETLTTYGNTCREEERERILKGLNTVRFNGTEGYIPDDIRERLTPEEDKTDTITSNKKDVV